MGKNKKRRYQDHRYSPARPDLNKKHYSSSSTLTKHPTTPRTQHHEPHEQMGKRPVFTSYLETPNLPPKIRLLCELLANTPSLSVEPFLEDTGLRVTQDDVEQVLKLCYGYPGPAVKFFRWAGYQLNDKHSPYAWNLVVDMLGKNVLFDAMWDAIKSMKKEGLLSLATFASVFSSYVIAGRVQEAYMAFDVMDQYGCPRDIIALNSLLSAICRDGKTENAVEFLHTVKNLIRPDADTYAILLEGWEKEGNVASARETFSEMVIEIGWDPSNVPAYSSFLNTLLKGRDGIYEAMKLFETINDRRCYPGMNFFKVAMEECVKNNDAKGAALLWETMIRRHGCRPDTHMYNSMVALHCYSNDIDKASRLLDEMVYDGVFPDAKTYNLLFHFLIKSRKVREASVVFDEMVKNDFVPSQENCRAAVRIFIDTGEPYVAIKVWKCMIENYDSDLEEMGNLLVVGLRDLNMIPEAVKYAEGMIEKGIKLTSSSLSKLKQSLSKARKEFVYEDLLQKWKTH